MTTATQRNRELSLSCALGDDALLIRRMIGSEALSSLFEYRLELLGEKADVRIESLLGTPMTVSVALPRGGARHFNGFVARFAFAGRHGRYAAYQATLRPWLWFLTRSADCRIFQDRSVVDIVKAVFDDYSIADFDTSGLSGAYGRLAYCVQYRETDFNFVSRLLEDAGIYYYFKARPGRHTMVLVDSYSAHEPIAGYRSLPYAPGADNAVRRSECIFDWLSAGEVQPGTFAVSAFDFEKPSASAAGSLLAKSSLACKHDQSNYEVFDYPGGYTERARGEALAKTRIEAYHAQSQWMEAASNARGLHPGGLFSLDGHPRSDQNGEALVVSAHYELAADEYEAVRPETPTPPFLCRFSALGKGHSFRPPMTASKPVVRGPQTALVVGKAGEELWTDKYGRVKVQFHWDRERPDDETSSCWVRVAQGWAGKRWGSLFIPRVGHEVIVSFLEGDPDRPIITGSVYNAETMPPYPLPDNATRSTVKSNSSKGGSGYNEIRFEDRKGSEQLFLHAEKNRDDRVKNDALEWVGNDRHQVVKKNSYRQIGGTQHTRISGDHNEKIDGVASLDVGRNIQARSGMNYALEAGTEVHIKAGMNVVIEAGSSITLKAGGAFAVIGPVNVTISGTPILLNSGGAPGAGAGSAPTVPEPAKEADDGKK